MGSLVVGHDWVTSLSLFTFIHWRRKWQPTPVFLWGESQGRGAWWAAISGVAQSWTWLKRLSSSSSFPRSSKGLQSSLAIPLPTTSPLPPSPGSPREDQSLSCDVVMSPPQSLMSGAPGQSLVDPGALLKCQSVQFSSVAQSCPTLCDPMNRSTPGLPVHHHLPEFIQTHVHWGGDAIQPSHPLSSPSSPAPNPSQHQSLFQWVDSSHEVAKVLEFQL